MCYKDFIPCRKCKNKKGPQAGYYYDTINGFTVAVECDCHKQWRHQKDLAIQYKLSNLENINYTFDCYAGNKSRGSWEALKEIAEDFPKFRHRMFYLFGENETQKTSMSKCLGKALIDKGYTVMFTDMQKLMTGLVTDFSQTDKEKEEGKALADRCMKVDFLILDESFDTAKNTLYSTGYQLPFLDTFIRNRFDTYGRAIMFISNRKPTEICSQGFGVSLENFVVRNTRDTTLVFMDNYSKSKNMIDTNQLFSHAPTTLSDYDSEKRRYLNLEQELKK